MKKAAIIVLAIVLILALAAGGWFLYDRTVDRSGWTEEGNARIYKDFHGDPVTGWQEIDGKTYYFLSNHAMATGWQQVDNRLCYFGEDGILATGWQKIGTETRYFGNDGTPAAGWLTLEGKRYYLPEGILATGWQEIDGKRYYFGPDGTMVTGTAEVEGVQYAFREDGTLTTGWEGEYYYLADGTTATGWQEIDGKRYCFGPDGKRKTGWVEEGEYRYYLKEDGSAAVGPYEIDGYTYHFSPSGIQVWLINGTHLVPDFYTPENEMAAGGVYLDKLCIEAYNRMFTDCQKAGNSPKARVGYRSYWDQLWIVNDTINSVGQSGLLYVAQPNASEHQLGLAVDITDSSIQPLNADQEKSGTYKWLKDHCWEYGFIVRYPNGTTDITGVGYEPWHFRYVGVEVAMEMKQLGITLEEYLGAA